MLNPLTAHITRDGWVVALAGNLVDFVDKHDAMLCGFNIIVGHLQQPAQDAFHVFAHITRFGKHRSVDNGERHLQQFCNGARQQGLACSRGAHHDNVTFFNLHPVIVHGLLQPFVMVVDRHRQETLGFILPNDVFI